MSHQFEKCLAWSLYKKQIKQLHKHHHYCHEQEKIRPFLTILLILSCPAQWFFSNVNLYLYHRHHLLVTGIHSISVQLGLQPVSGLVCLSVMILSESEKRCTWLLVLFDCSFINNDYPSIPSPTDFSAYLSWHQFHAQSVTAKNVNFKIPKTSTVKFVASKVPDFTLSPISTSDPWVLYLNRTFWK